MWTWSLIGPLIAFAPADLASGLSALNAGRVEEAIRILSEVVERSPCDKAADGDACYYLARALHTVGRYEEAQGIFDQMLNSPVNRTARLFRASALNYIALGQTAEAERHLLQAIKMSKPGSRDADPSVDYGAFLVRQGRATEAVALLEKAVAASPNSARGNIELGKALLHIGKTDQAAKRLEKAVELEAQNWAARLLLGKAYLQLGRKADGEREIKLGQEGWSKQAQGSSSLK